MKVFCESCKFFDGYDRCLHPHAAGKCVMEDWRRRSEWDTYMPCHDPARNANNNCPDYEEAPPPKSPKPSLWRDFLASVWGWF